MDLIVRILASHIERNRLDKVRNGLLNALTHYDCQAVLVEQVNYGHEKLSVVDLAFDTEKHKGEAVANIYDVRIVCILLIQLL